MNSQPKRRFPWGVLTVLFGIAAVVFLLAAVGLGASPLAERPGAVPTVTAPTSGTSGLATPTASATATPETANSNPSLWPPTATTFTDVLALMGGISSIGTLLSFIGLVGRGVRNVTKRVRRSPS